jgi:hypothetical protein
MDARTVWDNEIWPLLVGTFLHCFGAIGVSAMFAGTAKVLKLIFPENVFLGVWLDSIETVLMAATAFALGLLFVNSLVKLLADAVKATWKGFLNVTITMAA